MLDHTTLTFRPHIHLINFTDGENKFLNFIIRSFAVLSQQQDEVSVS